MGEFLFILLFLFAAGGWGFYYIIKMGILIARWPLDIAEEEEEELLQENKKLRKKLERMGWLNEKS